MTAPQNSNWDKNLVTKLKNSNCDKTQIFIKLNKTNGHKTKKI